MILSIVCFHLRIIWFMTHDSPKPSLFKSLASRSPSFKKKSHNSGLHWWYLRLKEKVLKENIHEIRRAKFRQNRAPGNNARYWTQWLLKLIFAMCKSRSTRYKFFLNSKLGIERFHSRDQQLSRFIGTKEVFYKGKRFNSHRSGLEKHWTAAVVTLLKPPQSR